MKKKINENSTRSPYKKRKQSKEKEKKQECQGNVKRNKIILILNTISFALLKILLP